MKNHLRAGNCEQRLSRSRMSEILHGCDADLESRLRNRPDSYQTLSSPVVTILPLHVRLEQVKEESDHMIISDSIDDPHHRDRDSTDQNLSDANSSMNPFKLPSSIVPSRASCALEVREIIDFDIPGTCIVNDTQCAEIGIDCISIDQIIEVKNPIECLNKTTIHKAIKQFKQTHTNTNTNTNTSMETLIGSSSDSVSGSGSVSVPVSVSVSSSSSRTDSLLLCLKSLSPSIGGWPVR